MVTRATCCLCGGEISGVFTDEQCWCAECVLQNPEAFAIDSTKTKTNGKMEGLLRRFHGLQLKKHRIAREAKRVKTEILFLKSLEEKK